MTDAAAPFDSVVKPATGGAAQTPSIPLKGGELKRQLSRATRRQKLRAIALVAPLGIFILLTFLYPIGLMLGRSVHSPEFGEILHRTAEALQQWDGEMIFRMNRFLPRLQQT